MVNRRQANSSVSVEIGCPHCRRVFSTAAAPGFIVYCPFCAREISIPDFVEDLRYQGIREVDDEATSFVEPKEQDLMPWFTLGIVVAGGVMMGFYLSRLYPADSVLKMMLMWFIGTVGGFLFARVTSRRNVP